MDLSLSADELAFQAEVRRFLDEHLTPELKRDAAAKSTSIAHPDVERAWRRVLHARGWAAPAWPREHGGTGWSLAQRHIFDRECNRAGVPQMFSLGANLLAPVLMKFGTPAQQREHLPGILSGDVRWCQGYSEPEAGSDLSSLRTRAVRDGDDYVVDGSKIWTSHAQYADWIFALVRTDSTPRKQDGISFLLIRMDTPGITVRPIHLISGEHEINQVFFENVRVPVVNLVGEEGRGWTCAKYLLEHERGGSFAANELRGMLDRLVRIAKHDGENRFESDPVLGRKLIELAVDVDTLEMLELTAMSGVAAGGDIGALPSIMILRQSLTRQAIDALALEIIGADALRWTAAVAEEFTTRPPLGERELMMPIYMNDRIHTIAGGTTEIQRGIIAKQSLGL
ncbi:acyl-CoA dehydrogenase family protein [Ramlibacter sp.]|uniref:acyl-CoA dehydrogenase family protein n=1 Tax=Ramlibacter sp. TaxID=1917967 RepID=UPI003D1393F2